MKKISDLLDGMFKKTDLYSGVHLNSRRASGPRYKDDVFDFLKLVHGWEEIVGPRLSELSIPLKNQRQRLTILVKHATLSSHLSFLETEIIKKIEKTYPALLGKIKKLSFQVDTTYFDQYLEKIKIQKLSRKSGRESKETKARETVEKTHLHPYSPEYRKLKKEALEFFGGIEDPEQREILSSLFFQLKSSALH